MSPIPNAPRAPVVFYGERLGSRQSLERTVQSRYAQSKSCLCFSLLVADVPRQKFDDILAGVSYFRVDAAFFCDVFVFWFLDIVHMPNIMPWRIAFDERV